MECFGVGREDALASIGAATTWGLSGKDKTHQRQGKRKTETVGKAFQVQYRFATSRPPSADETTAHHV